MDINLHSLQQLGVIKKQDSHILWGSILDGYDLSVTDFQLIRDIRQDDVSSELLVLLVLLMNGMTSGNICLSLDEQSLSKRLKAVGAIVSAKDILAYIDQTNSNILGIPGEYKPLIKTVEALYFQRYHVLEESLQRQLNERLSTYVTSLNWREEIEYVMETAPLRLPSGLPLPLASMQKVALLTGVSRPFSIISGGPGTGKTSIVVNILRCLLQKDKELLNNISLCAPTGRAAQRMMESINAGLNSVTSLTATEERMKDLVPSTIHRLLKYNPRSNSFSFNKDNLMSCKVLVVDEVSMIDLSLFSSLLNALPVDCKVILLGDKDQLPSVNAGAVLNDLIPSDAQCLWSEEVVGSIKDMFDIQLSANETDNLLRDSLVILEKSHRSVKAIYDFAQLINNADTECSSQYYQDIIKTLPTLEQSFVDSRNLRANSKNSNKRQQLKWPFDEEGCYFCSREETGLREWRQTLDAWMEEHFFSDLEDLPAYHKLVNKVKRTSIDELNKEVLQGLFEHLDFSRILTTVRRSRYGANSINNYLAKRYQDIQSGPLLDGVFAGLPIIITNNDYGLKLFNGDTGIALRDKYGLWAVFKDGHDFIKFPIDVLPSYEVAFAITVHKSQGSEYSRVLFVLPECEEKSHFTRELIYTAITRAKKFTVIIGESSDFESMIRNQVSRESGLKVW